MTQQRKIKVGIDVGGTFTHAVAVDIADYGIVGKACVPTTHDAEEGVARGVIDSLHDLLQQASITPEEVVLIAHSTTQATNALLEGDVAPVGILLIAGGVEGRIAQRGLVSDTIELAPGKILPTTLAVLDPTQDLTDDRIDAAIDDLTRQGAQVIAATSLYGPDHPELEDHLVKRAEAKGLIATAASRISQLYGLRVRTRTAVINASMMPRMLDTANLTEQAVQNSGIEAPLMIMRSDGGIMDIAEMRKRPILTMLSGPAAGVAAAIMYARISDGIFMEVGGTSTDISVIRNGKPQVKSAQIGGNRLYLSTLDVRTLGIAGGSIPRVSAEGRILDVGPRSAHIARLAYPAFSERRDYTATKVERFQPREGDPDDYLIIRSPNGEPDYSLTPTEASNLLDLVKVEGHGAANREAVNGLFAHLAELWQTSATEIAQALLRRGAAKLEPVLQSLKREYKLETDHLRLIGGGGGAAALVPFTGQHLDWPHEIVENTEVVSAIGAALGIIRDMVERSSSNPTDADLIAIRQEAASSVESMGADPESIEVSVEIDSRNKRIRAIATGSSDMRLRSGETKTLSASDLTQVAANSLGMAMEDIETVGQTRLLTVYQGTQTRKGWLGFGRSHMTRQRVLDREGIIRLQLREGVAEQTSPAALRGIISQLIEAHTIFGDAGALLPDLYVLVSGRILDLCGLVEASQVQALLDIELKSVPADEPVVVLAKAKR